MPFFNGTEDARSPAANASLASGHSLLQTPLDPCKTSAAANWAPLARFIDGEARIGHGAQRRNTTAFAYEFIRFGIKQGWACLFGAAMVALIVGTHLWYPGGAALDSR